MKKLDLFILKSYLGPLIMTFFIALFILLMQFLWKYVDDMVGKGLEWYIILKLLFYASSTFVPLALPLAILLSSLMMFGNLGEHYELVTLKAAGISLRRIMFPLVIVSFLICCLAFYFSDVIYPKASLKFLSLLYDIREKKLAFNLKEGVFYNGIEGFVIRVGRKDQDGNTIRDVMIYDHSKHLGNTSLTTAEWGRMEISKDKRFLVFRLYNGTNYEERVDLRGNEISRPFQRTAFKEQWQSFDLSSFQLTRTDENLFKKNYEMLNMEQLHLAIDSLYRDLDRERIIQEANYRNTFPNYNRYDTLTLAKDSLPSFNTDIICNFDASEQASILQAAKSTALSIKETTAQNISSMDSKSRLIYKHQIVLHKKFTFSIACFLLFFIGAPMGAIIRKGGLGMPAVISTLFFILFWIISFIGEKYTAEGVLPAWQGMWMASAVLLPIGMFLTYKANKDASLLDIEFWVRLVQKLFRIQRKQWI